ncbi:carbon-nitrogen hydrolase family protein [Mycobacterium sp. NPDC050853]|uniref:carbon-nitrogen hydrolase family protein n=1 Tax=Mycobacteriaceae TaxID=1762 RepID=UPI0015DDCE95|nr:carbon-nitrogen hydrolase family protein [Mycobacteroides sp. LB1]
MRIVLAQISSSADPTENLATVAATVRDAADQGAALVVFPEATMCRFGVPLRPVAEPLDGPWADGVRTIAQEAALTVVAGMFTPAPDGRVFNTLLATGPAADTHYNKIHLYDAFGFSESATVAPGSQQVLIEVDGVSVGLTTCYDIRFPDLYTDLARRGAQLITVSASWGAGTEKWDQWTLLARARAADSTSFIAAAGQALPSLETPASRAPTGIGGSLLASPTGELIAQAGPDPQLILADLDLDAVADTRRILPVLNPSSAE